MEPASPPSQTDLTTRPLEPDDILAAEALEEARLLKAYLPKEVFSRVPLVLFLSVAFHIGLAIVLTQLPASRKMIDRVIAVQVVSKHKTPPKPPPPRIKREPRKAPQQQAKQQPRPALAPRAGAGPAGGTFGVAADDGVGGTFEVPVGDTLEAPATQSAPAAPPPLVLDLSDDVRGAILEREPEPVGALRVAYPEVARLAAATGSALVLAYVEADGRVTHASLIRASSGTFGKAALEALRQTRFKPAVRKGVAVACSVLVPVAFELSAALVAPRSAGPATPSYVILPDLVATPSFGASASLMASASVEATGSLSAASPSIEASRSME